MKKLLVIVAVLAVGLTWPMDMLAQTQSKPFKRYMGLVEVGGGMGLGEWGANRVSLTMVNGFRIIPQFTVGAGVGLQMLICEYDNGSHNVRRIEMGLPMFLHLRSDFWEDNVSPFIACNIGYNMSLGDKKFYDGLLIEPTVGISFYVTPKNKMTAGLSFYMNKMDYTIFRNDRYDYGSDTGSTLNLKIGYSF